MPQPWQYDKISAMNFATLDMHRYTKLRYETLFILVQVKSVKSLV